MIKKALGLLVCLLLVTVLVAGSAGSFKGNWEDMPKVDSTQNIHDLGGYLTASEVSELEQTAKDISTQYGITIAVVTTDDTLRRDARAYGEDFYEANGFGVGEEISGLILVIDMQNRRVEIVTYGSAITTFTDRDLESILDDVFEYMPDLDLARAAGAFLDSSAVFLKVWAEKPSGNVPVKDTPYGTGNWADMPKVENTRSIHDLGDYIRPAELRELEVKAAQMKQEYGMPAVIVTTNDTMGRDARTYGEDFYEANGFGAGEDISGLIMVVDMRNRQVELVTYGKAIDIFTDQKLESILDDVFLYMPDLDIFGASSAYLRSTSAYLDTWQKQGGTMENVETKTPLAETVGISALMGFIISGIASAVAYAGHKQTLAGANHVSNYLTNRVPTFQVKADNFIRTSTAVRRNPPSDSGSGSGGSSTRTTSSGRTSGGSGRSFSSGRSSSGRSSGGRGRSF